MCSSQVLSLLVVFFVVGCSGHNFRLGGCPKVKVMKNFEVDKFLGDWYVIQRFHPMTTCIKATIEKSPEGVYTVNETSRPFGIDFGFGAPYRKARKMSFISNETEAIFKIQRSFTKFALTTYGVVDTDYEDFAILWGCDPLLFGSVQNLDILSRKPANNDDLVKDAKMKIKEFDIDIKPLEKIDQSSCGTYRDGSNMVVDTSFSNMFV